MKDSCSCSRQPKPPRQWATTAAGWLLPGVILAMVPKCPLCLAAYIAMATGIGLSLAVATYLRFFLIALCLAAFILFAASQWLRFRRTNSA